MAPAPFFGRQAASRPAVRFNLALQTTRAGQLLSQFGRSSRDPVNWEGLELFLGQQVARDDTRLPRVYENFAANLADVADLGRNAGATVLFATVPVNLRYSPPFASLHRAGLAPAELAGFELAFAGGRNAEVQGRWEKALAAYRQCGSPLARRIGGRR